MASTAAAATGGCGLQKLEASAGVVQHQWREFDGGGRRLVRERGLLPRLAVGATAACDRIELELNLAAQRGERDYAGLTSLGRPVTTTTDLQELDMAAILWWAAPDDWQPGLRIGLHEIDRRLRTVGSVLGYPERYHHASAALGLRRSGVWASGVAWTAQVWLGGHGDGRVRLDLPQADPTTLRTGAGRQFDSRLRLAWPVFGSAAPYVELQAGWRETAAGRARALTQDGRLVGTARQPRTVMQFAGVMIGREW